MVGYRYTTGEARYLKVGYLYTIGEVRYLKVCYLYDIGEACYLMVKLSLYCRQSSVPQGKVFFIM